MKKIPASNCGIGTLDKEKKGGRGGQNRHVWQEWWSNKTSLRQASLTATPPTYEEKRGAAGD